MVSFRSIAFNPVNGRWFSGFLIDYLRGRTGCFEVTLNLGLSLHKVCVEGGSLIIGNTFYRLDEVDPGGLDKVTLCEEEDGCYVVEARAGRYYKLKAVAMDRAPTVEIDGIHMHRVVGVDPWRDAEIKIEHLGVKRGDVVLDTCMGLGYTAIHSVRRGAETVVTVEVDANVVWIAERNPWSARLSDQRIVKILGDVTEVVPRLSDSAFSKVIHDPPRFTPLTGDLYSTEFYSELYRVLKPCGKLYHYTGEPRGGVSIVKGVGDRLRRVGFVNVRFIDEIEGYIALKPCR